MSFYEELIAYNCVHGNEMELHGTARKCIFSADKDAAVILQQQGICKDGSQLQQCAAHVLKSAYLY